MPTPLGIFGFSGGIGLFLSFFVLFLIVTYFALIYWTYLDARRRIEDPVLITCSVAASLFPFFGTVVYTILRPPEFIEDRQERELELRASELRLRELVEGSCPHCEYPVGRDFLSCPNCERKLRTPCRKCRKPLDPRWKVCPYCETAVQRRREPLPPQRARAQAAREARRGVSDPRDSDQRDRERRARAAEARSQQGAGVSSSGNQPKGGSEDTSERQARRVPRGRPATRGNGPQQGSGGSQPPRRSGD